MNTLSKPHRSSVTTKRQPIIMSKREAIKSAASSRMNRQQTGDIEPSRSTSPEPRGGLYGNNANLRRALADMQNDMNEICGNRPRRRQS